MISIFFKIL